MEKKIRIGIRLDIILELLMSTELVTERDGVEITIFNPEIWKISEEKDVEKIAKWRKIIKQLSRLN